MAPFTPKLLEHPISKLKELSYFNFDNPSAIASAPYALKLFSDSIINIREVNYFYKSESPIPMAYAPKSPKLFSVPIVKLK